MNIRQICRALLQLYPAEHRELFAAEMLRVLEEAAEEQRGRGWVAFPRFTRAELSGLLRGAAVEWIGKFTSRRLHAPVQPADEVTAAERQIGSIVSRMDYAIANHQFAKVRSLAEAERQAREKLGLLRESHKN
jgi:hypothetical protein